MLGRPLVAIALGVNLLSCGAAQGADNSVETPATVGSSREVPDEAHSEGAQREQPTGGLGIVRTSVDPKDATLQISRGKIRIAEQWFDLPDAGYRHIPQVRQELPSVLGQPLPEEGKVVTPRFRAYLADVAPETRGAEIFSVLQTAAFAGFPSVQIAPHRIVLHMRVPGPPGEASRAERVLQWPEHPLVVEIHHDRVDIYRTTIAKEGTTEKKELRTVPANVLDQELASIVAEACGPDQGPCTPFLLTVAEDGAGHALHTVLTALSRPESSSFAAPPQRALFLPQVDGPLVVSPRRARVGDMSVSGRLPPEKIKQAVRENFDQLRRCYEEGLERDPKLTGRVVVRFVIARDGSVSNAAASDQSTMPDAAVTECLIAKIKGLRFPRPDGGIVLVVYPLQFEPED